MVRSKPTICGTCGEFAFVRDRVIYKNTHLICHYNHMKLRVVCSSVIEKSVQLSILVVQQMNEIVSW